MIQSDGVRLTNTIHIRCNVVIAIMLQCCYTQETIWLRCDHSTRNYVIDIPFSLYMKFRCNVRLVEASFSF